MTAEVLDQQGRELAIVDNGAVVMRANVDEAIAAWQDYQKLTQALLDDTDYQNGGDGKRYKKKSAWRKYAKAFNISDRITSEQIIRDEFGWPIFARVRVEAYHVASGRRAEADHECHRTERCCPGAYGDACRKAEWERHQCCPMNCSGRQHWAHPGDIAATATTRAKNRAISDLIGAGEVSAEEMDENGKDAAPRSNGNRQSGQGRPRPPAGGAKKSTVNFAPFWNKAGELIRAADRKANVHAVVMQVAGTDKMADISALDQDGLNELLEKVRKWASGEAVGDPSMADPPSDHELDAERMDDE